MLGAVPARVSSRSETAPDDSARPTATTWACRSTRARRATKPIAEDVDDTQPTDWYRPRDLLPDGLETAIGADSALHETVDRVMLDTGLAHLSALDR